MNASRKTAIVVGVLFIVALISSLLSGVYAGSLDDPDYLVAVSKSEDQVLIGALFQLSLTASVVVIPILMFPLLKNHSERLAIGYIGARIFEGFFDVLIAISMLVLLSLSRDFIAAGAPATSSFQTSGALVQALREWAGIPEQFPYGLGVLILNLVFFQSELVPRWISAWGLAGGALILVMGSLRMFGYDVVFLAIPIVLHELILAVWLIVKGFNSSAINSKSDNHAVN